MARELGMITCAEMVRAFLDGRKTQTRRLIKPQPNWEERNGLKAAGWSWRTKKVQLSSCTAEFLSKEIGKESRYQVGDHLYAKETWAPHKDFDHISPKTLGIGLIEYAADGRESRPIVRWRSSRFMFKKHARIWRQVTEVKDPHRIQDISEEDVKAEGVRPCYKMDSFSGWHYIEVCGEEREDDVRWLGPWIVLWDRLHDKPGERWADNPWVFPYVLRIQEKPNE